ncbi:hypothetical protein [Streptosporangium sp. NPDC002524]|uniref:hypothetical protein n=1 Tax=Streptosporangium sp. NPDC002524 TaxID=3154537 RepID=UPI00333371EB
MIPRKSERTPGANPGRQVGVLAIAAVAGILMTSNQVPASATIGQDRVLGSISRLNADSTSGDRPSGRPDPSRRAHRGHETRPSDRWRGRPQRHQDRPYDRSRGRRGENAAPAGRERLTRSERMMRELQQDPSFPEIIVREK